MFIFILCSILFNKNKIPILLEWMYTRLYSEAMHRSDDIIGTKCQEPKSGSSLNEDYQCRCIRDGKCPVGEVDEIIKMNDFRKRTLKFHDKMCQYSHVTVGEIVEKWLQTNANNTPTASFVIKQNETIRGSKKASFVFHYRCCIPFSYRFYHLDLSLFNKLEQPHQFIVKLDTQACSTIIREWQKNDRILLMHSPDHEEYLAAAWLLNADSIATRFNNFNKDELLHLITALRNTLILNYCVTK